MILVKLWQAKNDRDCITKRSTKKDKSNMCFLAQVPHWPKYCLGQQFVLETGRNLRWQQVNKRKKRKGEVLKNDWLKLPVMEEYCIYGAWLNKYINLPACFHKDQKLRGLVGMIPFHRSKPGIVLGEKIWHFFKRWPIVFVSVFAFVIFGYAILYGVRIELQKLSIQYERLGNRTASNYSAGTWMSQY